MTSATNRFVIFAWLAMFAFGLECASRLGKPRTLRVMTFNTWKSGGKVIDGMRKLVSNIREVNPDVAALQEITDPRYLEDIVSALTNQTGVHREGKVADRRNAYVAILSRHRISDIYADKPNHHIGADVQLSEGMNISFWAFWNDYYADGPVEVYKKSIVDNWTMMRNEANRLRLIKELVAEPAFQSALQTVDSKPVLIAGDFNCPSHMDWIYESRREHFNSVYPWPATKYLTDEVGMLDSYREVHPNVTQFPGITWSTMERWNRETSEKEPQNRIDFIFLKGPRLRAVTSEIVPQNGQMSVCHKDCECGETCWAVKNNNAYPSDHFSVYTDFEWQ